MFIAAVCSPVALDHPNPEIAGKPLFGCPRVFFVVADEQGELYIDPEGLLRVRPAVDVHGLARAMWEMPRYRLPLDSSGEESNLPVKIDDDWTDQFKALADEFFPPPTQCLKRIG